MGSGRGRAGLLRPQPRSRARRLGGALCILPQPARACGPGFSRDPDRAQLSAAPKDSTCPTPGSGDLGTWNQLLPNQQASSLGTRDPHSHEGPHSAVPDLKSSIIV